MSDTGQVRSGKERDLEVFRSTSLTKSYQVKDYSASNKPPPTDLSHPSPTVGTFGLAKTNVPNPPTSIYTPVIDMNTVVHRRIFFFRNIFAARPSYSPPSLSFPFLQFNYSTWPKKEQKKEVKERREEPNLSPSTSTRCSNKSTPTPVCPKKVCPS